jgi:hypothetical protein
MRDWVNLLACNDSRGSRNEPCEVVKEDFCFFFLPFECTGVQRFPTWLVWSLTVMNGVVAAKSTYIN